MQIHEIALTENFKKWLGLDKPTTQAAWNDLKGTAMAQLTNDPRYKNLPLDQRIDVMSRDAAVNRLASEKSNEFAEYYKNQMYANQNKPLGPAVFKASMYNFLSRRVFGQDVANLTPDLKQKLDQYISQAQRSTFDFRTGFGPEFEQAMKDLVALKLVAQYQRAPVAAPVAPAQLQKTKIAPPPPAGAPTSAEQAKLQQMIQQKLGAVK